MKTDVEIARIVREHLPAWLNLARPERSNFSQGSEAEADWLAWAVWLKDEHTFCCAHVSADGRHFVLNLRYPLRPIEELSAALDER
jgi:hypothetical protein